MIFTSYTKTDTYYEFTSEDGVKYIIPSVNVVLVDDLSGTIAVKNTASRSVIGLLRK